MVVPVFITNCQVSEKLNTGPVTIHIIMIRNAMIKAAVLPDALVAIMDILSNPDGFLGSFFFMCKSLKCYDVGYHNMLNQNLINKRAAILFPNKGNIREENRRQGIQKITGGNLSADATLVFHLQSE